MGMTQYHDCDSVCSPSATIAIAKPGPLIEDADQRFENRKDSVVTVASFA